MTIRQIDLRSDTVTHPTPAMREAIYRAEVGDDVFGDDPTVNRLQDMAAEMFGKEAALFVASGTMGNLIALLAHCGRGDEIILGDQSHTFIYEAGGSAALGGIHHWTVENQPDGTIELADIASAIRPDDAHFPRTRLLCLENTHNRCGGVVLTPEYTQKVCDFAHERGLKVHLDGARVFNAAVALGVDVRELVRDVDSVTFCLSKGLACPVGSVLCGTRDFIHEAHRARKILGGGMRQAGFLAAAGVVALNEMIARLAEDHANAKRLAEGLARIEGIAIDLQRVQTNIVYFELPPHVEPPEWVMSLSDRGVRVMALGRRVRAVTHYGITAEDIERALEVIREVMKA